MRSIKTTRTLLSILFTLLVVGGTPLRARGQASDCAVKVIARVENSHTYYEVIGTGFPPSQQVKVEAVNRSAQQRRTFLVRATEAGISGIFIGKGPDRNYYQITPGRWKVRARAKSCGANTKFTVHESASAKLPVGVWGGSDISLRVTDSAVAINFFCGVGALNQPLVPDGKGNFDVSGTYAEVKLGWPPQKLLKARYAGRIEGSTMTLTVTLVDANVSLGTYTLTFGQKTPPSPCR
jgi:hypothetical protein